MERCKLLKLRSGTGSWGQFVIVWSGSYGGGDPGEGSGREVVIDLPSIKS